MWNFAYSLIVKFYVSYLLSGGCNKVCYSEKMSINSMHCTSTAQPAIWSASDSRFRSEFAGEELTFLANCPFSRAYAPGMRKLSTISNIPGCSPRISVDKRLCKEQNRDNMKLCSLGAFHLAKIFGLRFWKFSLSKGKAFSMRA